MATVSDLYTPETFE